MPTPGELEVPNLSFFGFDKQGEVKGDSASSCSMGTVDMLLLLQRKFCEHGVILNSCKATPLKFTLANGADASSTEVMPIPLLLGRVVVGC